MKPYLRDEIPKIPDVPSYDAGYLVTKNASWRSEKPVVCSEKCTGCLQCYLYCPDGVISKEHQKSAYGNDRSKPGNSCGIGGNSIRTT